MTHRLQVGLFATDGRDVEQPHATVRKLHAEYVLGITIPIEPARGRINPGTLAQLLDLGLQVVRPAERIVSLLLCLGCPVAKSIRLKAGGPQGIDDRPGIVEEHLPGGLELAIQRCYGLASERQRVFEAFRTSRLLDYLARLFRPGAPVFTDGPAKGLYQRRDGGLAFQRVRHLRPPA